MISKELLSEVLNIENERISRTVDKFCFPNTNTIAVQYYMTDGWQHINIYELSNKCKEWAFKQGYELFSRILSNDHQPVGNCVVYRVEADPEESLCITNADTEQEAIFKASEWVLKEMK